MLSSLINLSPLTLIIGIIIILMSVVEAFATGKTVKERLFKASTAALAIFLLFIQAASNKRSEATNQAALKKALDKQRGEITKELASAFKAGTDEVVTIAGQEEDKTRRAADDQTKKIELQGTRQGLVLADASLGSSLCPQLVADHISSDRPYGLSVFNFDKTANIYDLVVYVQEGEHAGADGRGFRTLQQKTLRFPTVPAGAGTHSQPFEFLSQRNTSFLQYSLSTRRKICSGQIVLHGDGNGNWRPESYAVHEGPLSAHNTEVPPEDQP